MSRFVNKPGYYPQKETNETIHKIKLLSGKKAVLLVKYETERRIKLYIGGHDKWCIYCELIKNENIIKQTGYLIKVRYDILCSLDEHYIKGRDTQQLMNMLIQYIFNTYPTVKELSFNDLSIKRCNNDADVNLAVMTYLYTGKTWYEKNFNAYPAMQSIPEITRILQKYNDAKKIQWDDMKEVIQNHSIIPFNETEIETLYANANTWKDFFEPIYAQMEIADFCNFISSWLDTFILYYFNNLQGLIYMIPIENKNIAYKELEYIRGGRRYTKKSIKHISKDYK
jgi:hypothetical protein